MIRRNLTYNYHDTAVDYDVWLTSDDGQLDTIIFLGTVQIGKMPEWVAAACPPRTAIVQGAPHWYAKDDGSDIPDFMFGYTRSVLESLLTDYMCGSLSIIAESQAAPGVVQLLATDTTYADINNVVLLQPLGFSAMGYADTDEERMALFKKRLVHNARRQLPALLSDGRFRYSYRTITKVLDTRQPKTWAWYNSGLTHDILPNLKKVVSRGCDVTVICGANDKLFPADEVRVGLRRANVEIPVIEVRGVTHPPLGSRQGMRLLRAAFAVLDTV